jgi:DNA-binding transcriptional LysR family regulator
LFDRLHNRIRLTTIGEQAYRYAQEILELHDDMELRLGTLAALQLSPPINRPFSLIYEKRKFRSRAIQNVLAFTREHFGSLHKCPITSTR